MRIVCSSRSALPDERLDLALHALAQLPQSSTLDLCLPTGPARESLLGLAQAYGLKERVQIHHAPQRPRPDGAQLLYTSDVNMARTKLAPGEADTPPLVLGQGGPLTRSIGSMAELLWLLDPGLDGSALVNPDDECLRGRRVAVVTNLITHYRMPLFNRLAERLASVGASLLIVTTGHDPHARTWSRPTEGPQFEHISLSSSPGSLGPREATRLARTLRAFDAHIVLTGGFGPAALVAAGFAATRNRTLGVWSGDLASLQAGRSRLRHLERRALAQRCQFAIAYGFRAREYLRSLAPDLLCVYGRNTAPIRACVLPREERSDVELITVARLAPEKRLDVVIDAALALGDLPYRLTVVGDGPLRDQLEHRARHLKNVRFIGAVPSDEVLGHYLAADVFLLPSSREPFGLALVEAMAAGAAVLVARPVGAVGDLAIDRINSLVLDGHDPGLWAAALRELIASHSLRLSLGDHAERTIHGRWTVEHAADAMVAGLRLGALTAPTA
jgi:glycosyltransferase involved in cell wall biosynthesis